MTVQTFAEQMRAWRGPALFSYGFRPLFFFAAVWVMLAMGIWLLMLAGRVDLPSRFDPLSWHAHEFLFGYLGAVLAGFLLTAVPNWTGRLPIVGWRLAALFVLWCAGRVAIMVSAGLPAALASVIDLAFPLVLGAVILREIVAGRNWRNLIVLALLMVFTLANGLFHWEALRGGVAAQGVGLRLGLATAIMMIAVIGGRIIPSFTRNWLARMDNSVRPAPPMQCFDKLTLLISLPVLLLWVLRPEGNMIGGFLLAFAALHLIRQARWQPLETRRDPLVWILHVSYGFIPLGAFALGLALVTGGSSAAAQHLWMSGAIGAMTLAVMSRATLGHTGQALQVDRVTVAVYLSIIAATELRSLAPLWAGATHLSGLFWLFAFAGFLLAYGPALWRKKPEGSR
ncbi:NnrS family protein [Sulfitobacter sp. 1A05707]|uniref:NnrS family protein n=1 Tax=Sulfitobacter sp. 1A05707 TaxID=3368560 RepID=UPI0037459132